MTMNDTEKYPVTQEEADWDDSTKRPAAQKASKPKAWPEPKLKRGGLGVRDGRWKAVLALIILAWLAVPVAAIVANSEEGILGTVSVAAALTLVLPVVMFFYLASANRLKTIPEEQLIIETFGDFCEVKGFQGKLRRRVRTPETYRGMKITAIHGGFAKNKRLHTVALHDAVATLPEGFFAGCRSLEMVRLPGKLTSVPARLLEGCGRIKAVVVPVNVQSIGSRAFAGCAMLRDMYLTSAVQEIAGDAFEGCTDMMFHVQAGSEAERFARDRGINYTYQ